MAASKCHEFYGIVIAYLWDKSALSMGHVLVVYMFYFPY